MVQSAAARKRVCGAAARVVRVWPLCREHVALDLELSDFPASRPGQFVELLCGDGQALATCFLRRPFSIADHQVSGAAGVLTIISRAVGPGTKFLDQRRAGDTLDVTGPLGTPFELPGPATPVVLVGGGVGIPPLLYAAGALWESGHRDTSVIFGVTTGDLLPVELTGLPRGDGLASTCLALPGGAAYPALITTDDGALGLRGRVTDGLSRLAEQMPGRAALVLACGPEPMLRAVSRLTRSLGWAAQLCIERYMGCGLATCLSCVVRVCDPRRQSGWRWSLSCTEGPVYERERLYGYDLDPRSAD